jgi:protein suppressor of PHYA-105 1
LYRPCASDYLLKPVTKKAVKHMWAHVWRRKQRHQMVPRFENGQEVVESDEFDQDIHQMRGMGGRGMDMDDGVLPVPSTEEYSSDGGSEDMEDEYRRGGGAENDDDERRHAAARDYYAAEYVFASENGTDERDWEEGAVDNSRQGGATDVPGTASALGAGGGGRCPRGRDEIGEAMRGGRNGAGAAAAAAAAGKRPAVQFELTPDGQCPFALPGKKMEKVEEGEMEGEEEEKPYVEVDPLLVEDGATGMMRRLRPVLSIEGLSGERLTLRAWIDAANSESRPVGQQDRLHVLKQAAGLLASHHEGGVLLGAMRPSKLSVSPQGDVTLALPRPATPPRSACEAGASGGGAGGTENQNHQRGRGRLRLRRDSTTDGDDEDSDEEDDDDEDDDSGEDNEDRNRLAAAAAAAAANPNVANANVEALYISPEERCSGTPGGAPAECFALGVLMVELCWPAVACGAAGDLRLLLSATLKPDGGGSAALANDPVESAIARQLLQPVPGGAVRVKSA